VVVEKENDNVETKLQDALQETIQLLYLFEEVIPLNARTRDNNGHRSLHRDYDRCQSHAGGPEKIHYHEPKFQHGHSLPTQHWRTEW